MIEFMTLKQFKEFVNSGTVDRDFALNPITLEEVNKLNGYDRNLVMITYRGWQERQRKQERKEIKNQGIKVGEFINRNKSKRTTCIRCNDKLPFGKRKYCNVCSKIARSESMKRSLINKKNKVRHSFGECYLNRVL